MKHKHWTNIVREVFPRAEVFDAALAYPITDYGWDVNVPLSTEFCNFADPQYRLVINLQDMLTRYEDHRVPGELTKLHQHFTKNNFPMEKIIVLIWPLGIKKDWPKDSFHLIEFSSHQYETWCAYKDAEDVLQTVFIKIAQHRESVAKAQSLKSYLFRMGRNEALNRLKKIKTLYYELARNTLQM